MVSPSASVAESAKIGRFCIVEDDAVLDDGVVLGDYVLVRKGAHIGANTKVGAYSQIGERVSIGANSSFSSYCEIRADCVLGSDIVMGSRGTLSAGTIVEDDVIMKYAFVTTDTPDLTRNDEKVVGRLRRGSRFGALVVIMPGVEIGENSEIGACSQVRKDVPSNEVWFGIPAKFYRESNS